MTRLITASSSTTRTRRPLSHGSRMTETPIGLARSFPRSDDGHKTPVYECLTIVASLPQSDASDRLDLAHVGQEMPQQVLDAVLEGRGRGRAAGAGALHVEVDHPVLEAPEGDVAAVARDRRADAGLEELLDGLDGGRVLGVEEL